MVTSSTILHSGLNKHCNTLSYHKVRESIAANIAHFEYIPTGENPADIMTKALPCVHVEPLLFWKGKTSTEPTRGESDEGLGHSTKAAPKIFGVSLLL